MYIFGLKNEKMIIITKCVDCFKSKSNLSKRYYKQKNKKSIREKDLLYRKERMFNDPLYRAKIDARNIIRKALNERGYSKKSRTVEILGCSFDKFKQHIESLFIENMTWKNRNEWHIEFTYKQFFNIYYMKYLKLFEAFI